jgi:hypothetical protein
MTSGMEPQPTTLPRASLDTKLDRIVVCVRRCCCLEEVFSGVVVYDFTLAQKYPTSVFYQQATDGRSVECLVRR